MIGKLFAQYIIMTPPGIIESAGFAGVDGGVNGYRFTAATGLLEAIGAKLKHLTVTGNSTFEGTLNAKNISITGEVTAGDGFVLRTNNIPMAVPHNDNAWHYLKSITTFARGSCKIKLGFEYGNLGGSVEYRLYRNGVLFGTYDASTASVVMPLIESRTTIDIMARYIPTTARPAMPSGFGVGKFELWVEFDPGMLSMLGY